MKVIIAGSRNYNNSATIHNGVISSGFIITEVVSGMASGVDNLGLNWAKFNDIPYKEFPADWNKYGRSAGPRRNRQMAEYADALILFWDGKSAGSKSMLNEAKNLKLLIKEVKIKT